MSLPATDNFNRADGDIGANWTTVLVSGTRQVVATNKCQPSAGSGNVVVGWNADAFNADQYAQILVSTAAQHFGPAVRGDVSGATDACYFLQWTAAGANGAALYKRAGGSFTQIGTYTGPVAGDLVAPRSVRHESATQNQRGR
jgi:hypothetical protein